MIDNEVTTVQDGKLAMRTVAITGDRLPEKALDKLKYVTTYVETTGGTELAVKVVPLNNGGGGGSIPTLTTYTGNTGTSITITDTSSSPLVKVYKNGVLLEPTEDYSISGTTLTLTVALEATDKITTEVF